MDHPSPLASSTLGLHGRTENALQDRRRIRTIGGNDGGIRRQIREPESGLLVDSIDEVSDHLVQVLTDPGLRHRLATRAEGTLREHYLTGRLAEEGLDLLGETVCRGD